MLPAFPYLFLYWNMQVGRKVFIYTRRTSTTAKSGWRSSKAPLAGRTVLAPGKQSMPDLSNANDRQHLSQFGVCAHEYDFSDPYLSANHFKNAVAARPAPPIAENTRGVNVPRSTFKIRFSYCRRFSCSCDGRFEVESDGDVNERGVKHPDVQKMRIHACSPPPPPKKKPPALMSTLALSLEFTVGANYSPSRGFKAGSRLTFTLISSRTSPSRSPTSLWRRPR